MLHAIRAADHAEPWEDPTLGAAVHGQARARREGADFDELAYQYLEQAGGRLVKTRHRVGAVTVDAVVEGAGGAQFWVLAHGNVDVDSHATLPGLRRTDTIRKAGCSAAVLAGKLGALPVLLITSHLPTENDRAARDWLGELSHVLFDVISIYDDLRGFHRLRGHLVGPAPSARCGAAGEWVAAAGTQLSMDNLSGWRDA
jgi:hypothetical protein